MLPVTVGKIDFHLSRQRAFLFVDRSIERLYACIVAFNKTNPISAIFMNL